MSCLAVIAAVIGVVAYMINCRTDYFAKLGMDNRVVGCAVAAIVVLLLYMLIAGKGPNTFNGLFPICAGVLLTAALLFFAQARVNGIAAIMTFEGNAQTMADLMSVFVGLGGFALAMLLTVFGSFFDVAKEA